MEKEEILKLLQEVVNDARTHKEELDRLDEQMVDEFLTPESGEKGKK